MSVDRRHITDSDGSIMVFDCVKKDSRSEVFIFEGRFCSPEYKEINLTFNFYDNVILFNLKAKIVNMIISPEITSLWLREDCNIERLFIAKKSSLHKDFEIIINKKMTVSFND